MPRENRCLERENRVEKSRVHFAWQAQYLVKLECDFSWQAQHLVTFWEIAGARNVVFFNTKCVSKMGQVRSPKWRVRDDDFMLGCPRKVVESSFYWRKQFTEFPLKSWTYRFRGRRSIWWGWWLTVLAPRIGNDVSCVTRITHGIHFAWQAQYLLRLEVDFACSAHWKWRFIWDADQSWDSFCVAGAVLGEVGMWLFVAGAAFGDILGDSRSAKCCIFQYKMRLQDGTSQVSEAAGARWRFHARMSSECRRIVFILAEAIQGLLAEILNSGFRGRCSTWWVWRVTLLAPRIGNDVSYVTRINHEIHFALQAQYLVKLRCEVCCSAHCKWRFICDADQSWDSFCVAGAVFGEVGLWLPLLRALEMTFHMRRGSIMRFILRGRRSIWWSWIVTPVAPRIVNGVSCETRINHEIHFVWQAQYLVKLDCDSCCSAHCKWRLICDADQSSQSFCVAGAVLGEVGGWLLLLRAL